VHPQAEGYQELPQWTTICCDTLKAFFNFFLIMDLLSRNKFFSWNSKRSCTYSYPVTGALGLLRSCISFFLFFPFGHPPFRFVVWKQWGEPNRNLEVLNWMSQAKHKKNLRLRFHKLRLVVLESLNTTIYTT